MLERRFAEVCIHPLEHSYSYAVPHDALRDIEVGSRVKVPLGKRSAEGFVVRCGSAEEFGEQKFEFKELDAASWPGRLFTTEQLRFFSWVAAYYVSPLSHVIETAIPRMVPPKMERFVELVGAPEGLKGNLQAAIVAALSEAQGTLPWVELSRRFKGFSAVVKRLEALGVVAVRSTVEAPKPTEPIPEWAARDLQLNAAQQVAFEQIVQAMDRGVHETKLLHGVTGSGKTEVYIEAIRTALSRGRGVLVLVPEIALTPQLIDRFRARLGNDMAVLHSGLHDRERSASWQSLIEGRSKFAIGARSAIFAPVHDLGLIIVDEEHDASYKQAEGLRYNARDLAMVRGLQNQACVVLGSATPSLESYHHATTGKYGYLSLPMRPRATAELKFQIVDLNRIKPWEMKTPTVSMPMFSALEGALSRGEQAFVLYNRRGFASYLQCETCEEVVQCPNCSVTMTYHRHSHSLLCHYCNFSSVPPVSCSVCPKTSPDAKPGNLIHRGAGTEKILEELQSVFPNSSIARLDRDVIGSLAEYREILQKMRAGEIHILVGTQMIAKGHDLPNVTVAAVADCDVGLHIPDFRAGERAFQLLTQAAGRAGRGDTPGLVVLQTRLPKHPSLRCVEKQDFKRLAEIELQQRQQLNYPPYSRLARIISQATESDPALHSLNQVRQALLEHREGALQGLQVLGPAPSAISRVKAKFRFQLLLKSSSVRMLQQAARMAQAVPRSRNVQIIVDIDPQDML